MRDGHLRSADFLDVKGTPRSPNYNQVVQAGIAAVGTTLKVEPDIRAVQDESLPQA